uniref:Nucleolin n=1 Tax=Rhizophora mucronata TaxID=61149 RepID=A0A2P2QRD9_RHIMU
MRMILTMMMMTTRRMGVNWTVMIVMT